MLSHRVSLLITSLTLVWAGIAVADTIPITVSERISAEASGVDDNPEVVSIVTPGSPLTPSATPAVALTQVLQSRPTKTQRIPEPEVSSPPSIELTPTPALLSTPVATPVPSATYRIEGPNGVLSGDIPVTGGHVGQVTQAIAQKHGTTFAYDTSDMGWFVLELAGVKNEPRKGRYWLFEVNGKFSEKGVDQIFLRPGDTLVWRY